MTTGTLQCLDVVVVYSVEHIIRVRISHFGRDVRPLSHWQVSLDSPVLFLSNLFHERAAVLYPEFHELAEGKRVDNVHLTSSITHN